MRRVAGRWSEQDAPNILPTADIPAYALIEHRDALPAGARLLVPPLEALAVAHDKIRLMELAASLGVPVPDGFPAGPDLARDPRLAGSAFRWCSSRPRRATSRAGAGTGRGAGRSRTARRWRGRCRSAPEFAPGRRFLVQQKVPGEGRGVFVLAQEGTGAVRLPHRRVREKPPWGGVSTLCEVAPPDPALVEHARRLMEALRWTGVAMVEFKHDPATGRSWLMEINGRFWGSIQLAIAAGVDFPWLYVRQALTGAAPGPVDADPRVRMLVAPRRPGPVPDPAEAGAESGRFRGAGGHAACGRGPATGSRSTRWPWTTRSRSCSN